MKRFIILVTVGFVLSCGLNLWSADNSPAAITAKKELSSNKSFTQIPFIKNEGQIQTPEVKFYAKVINGSVFITDKGEFVYNIITQKDYLGADDYIQPDGSFPCHGLYLKEIPVRQGVETGHAPSPQVIGLEPAETVVNFFLGDKPENWRTNIQTYKLITLGEVWEGITLNLKANRKNIEKLFVISPQGNVESIRFSVAGIDQLILKESGELELKTSEKSIGFTHPIAYQEINGNRKDVEVSYHLINKTTYGFVVGEYDKTVPLIIDPILSSTFIGGTLSESGQSVAIDSSGNIFVTGSSNSVDYPTAGEGGLPPYNPNWTPSGTDIVVSKFNPTLSVLLASTFVGSPSSDAGLCMAIDTNNNVFVAGFATGTGFPTATDKPNASPLDTSYNGPQIDPVFPNPINWEDVCVIKLNNNLTRLLASTYIGGSSSNVDDDPERANDITIDIYNNIYICGTVNNGIFPANGWARNNFGGQDAFVIKLNNNLSGYTPSEPNAFYFAGTFIGGTPGVVNRSFWGPGEDWANGIAVDYNNNVFITGVSSVGQPDFPTTNAAYNTDRPSGQCAFICKLRNDLGSVNPASGGLIASTFLGGEWPGAGGEIGTDILVAIQGDNSVYVCGVTGSTTFPITSGAYNFGNPPGLGVQDIFLSRLNNTLTALINSTWIGGVATESANSICQSKVNNDIYICGSTDSPDYPTTPGCYGSINNGSTDAIISVFNENLSSLNASTYIGGSENDSANCIRTDKTGNILIAGTTSSGVPPSTVSFPVWPISGTDTAYDITFNYNPGVGLASDIFVTRITNDLSSGDYTPPPPSGGGGQREVVGSSGDPAASKDSFTKQLGTCFIATAVYGSPAHPNVVALRNFRDKYLLTNRLGSKFVHWYYKVSPKIADYLKVSPFKASIVRLALTPIVYTIRYPIPIGLGALLLIGFLIYRRKFRRGVL